MENNLFNDIEINIPFSLVNLNEGTISELSDFKRGCYFQLFIGTRKIIMGACKQGITFFACKIPKQKSPRINCSNNMDLRQERVYLNMFFKSDEDIDNLITLLNNVKEARKKHDDED